MEYAILFLPLIGSIITYFAKTLGNIFSQVFSSLLVSISAILSFYIFYEGIINNDYGNYLIFEWINSGDFKVNWSINIDPLSAVMIMVDLFFLVLFFNQYTGHDPLYVYGLIILIYFLNAMLSSFR